MDVPLAANVLGTLGAVCWSVQLIPQIVINYRRHDTDGLQPSMMLLWASAGVPLGTYNIVEEFNIALRIQPQILTLLSLITWSQCQYYGQKYSIVKCVMATIPLAILMAGIETALIFSLRIAKDRSVNWPITLMAVLSTCLLSAGVLRHYWDIYTHRTVRGISFIFVGIDAAGDVFSLLSVFFQPKLDILGIIIYSTEFILWLGIFACGGFFTLRPWLTKKRASRQRAARDEQNHEHIVSLHPMPSSTSVFRTASGTEVVSRRATVMESRSGHE